MHSVSPIVLHLFLVLRVAHLATLFLDKVHDKVHKHEDDENRAHHSHESPEWQLAFAVEQGRDTLISILSAARVSALLIDRARGVQGPIRREFTPCHILVVKLTTPLATPHRGRLGALEVIRARLSHSLT